VRKGEGRGRGNEHDSDIPGLDGAHGLGVELPNYQMYN